MPEYLPSLAERKARLFEDVCATCGGDGDASDGMGNAMDDSEDQDPNTTLMRTLKTLKKNKAKKKLKEEEVMERVAPDLERNDKEAKEFAKQDARMKYGKAGKPTDLMPGEVRKVPKKRRLPWK